MVLEKELEGIDRDLKVVREERLRQSKAMEEMVETLATVKSLLVEAIQANGDPFTE